MSLLTELVVKLQERNLATANINLQVSGLMIMISLTGESSQLKASKCQWKQMGPPKCDPDGLKLILLPQEEFL